MTDKPQEVSYQSWIHFGEGGGYVSTHALEPHHPLHPYNQLVAQGVKPEDYGMIHPDMEKYQEMSRVDLLDEIMYLNDCIETMMEAERMGFKHSEGRILKSEWINRRLALNGA